MLYAGKYGGIGKKEVIKKRNGNGSKTSESGGTRKKENKTRPNEGERTEEEEGLRKRAGKKEG